MLSQYSLQALVDISHHPAFGPAVQTVTIAIDHLREIDLELNYSNLSIQSYATLFN